MSDPNFALPEHPQRRALNDEVHARPPVRLMGPHRIVFLALRHEPSARGAHRDAIGRLAEARGESLQSGDHGVLRLADNLRLKWEGHAEFSSYTFFREGESRLTPGEVLAEARWAEFAKGLPGEVFVAATIELARGLFRHPLGDDDKLAWGNSHALHVETFTNRYFTGPAAGCRIAPSSTRS